MNISEFIFRSLGPLLLIAALTCWHPLNDALLDAQRVTKQTLLQENSVYNQGADDSSVTTDSFVIATAAEVRAALLTPSDKQIIVDLSDYESILYSNYRNWVSRTGTCMSGTKRRTQ